MTINERDRHDMHAALRKALGAQEADTLMEHLPPVGWADVATKRDVDGLRVATKRDLDALKEYLELRIEASGDRLRAEMERGFARTLRWNVGTVIAMAGIVLAITRFT